MTTNEAFLRALNREDIKAKYPASSIRSWRSRAIREKLSLDFMVEFLNENGCKMKQSMQWIMDGGEGVINHLPGHNRDVNVAVMGKDYKLQLSKKLYAVRKQLNAELFANWYEWSKAEYAKDFPVKNSTLSTVVFSQITYGRYISKENIPFAIKALKEGKRLLSEYNEYIKREVESL